MKRLANRLRLAREQAGLSQAQVARLIKKHRPTISEIEAGRRKVSADELEAFSRIYEVTISWLTGSDEALGREVNERVQLAARELAKLKADDLDRVLNLLATMRGARNPKK